MKTHLILGALLPVIVWASCSFSSANAEKGNGTIVTKDIEVAQYHSIIINEHIENSKNILSGKGNFRFSYKQVTGVPTLQLSIDENLFPMLDINVEDGMLRISTKDKAKIAPTHFTLSGTSEMLRKVQVNGVMDFYAETSVKAEDVDLSVNGVGNIVMEQLECASLKSKVSGVGDIRLKGSADTGNFQVSGVGKIQAFDFMVKDLKCQVSGVGGMQVAASEKLDAHTSGVGNIRYKGGATDVTKHASGVGNIKQAD